MAEKPLLVAADLQRVLIEEEERLLKDIQTQSVSGETVSGVKGYEQRLPLVLENDADESQFFPYFIVRISDGKTEDDDSPWIVTLDILFGCHDDSPESTGHRHIMNMIERTIDRFAAEPLLAGLYRAEPDIEWALQDDDTYPFYFGGVRMKFNIPKIGRRIPDYGKNYEDRYS